LRAKDDNGHTSDWSRVFSLTTTSDTVAPKTPTNVANTVSGTAFKFTWDAVTVSADNSPAHDLNGYLVRVSTPANGITRIYQTTDTKMDFSFENNVAVFGTPQGTVRVEVAATDNIGNVSPYSAMVSASNPAPAAVTGLTATPGTDSINIKWTANTTDNDLKGYEVWLSTTGAAGAYSKVYSGLANSYVHPTLLYTTDHFFRVYSVDVFNTQSTATTSSAIRPNSPFTVDTTAPSVPSGLAATLTNAADGKTASAAVSWTAVADPDNDLSEYIIGYKPSATSDWQYTKVDYTQISTTINGLLPFTNYDFRIRSSDWSANLSAWSAVVTKTAVANAAPSVPTGLAITPGRDSVIVRWTANTEPDMANGAGVYDVTLSTSSTFASGNLQYRTGADNITITGLNTTTTYYARVRATDSGGLSSAYSASVNATTGTIPSTPGDIGAASQVDLNAARLAAYKSSGLSANPNFSEWAGGAGSAPDSWVLYGGTPIKETTNVRTAPYAFRQTITSAISTGIYGASSGNLADLPLGLEYVTVEVDVKLISGNFSASGVLLDWTGMTPPAPRAYMSFNDAVPNPVMDQWYRITRVLRRPTNLVGTQTSWTSYLMTNYQAGTTNWGLYTNKDIIFDRVQYRPSTQEEIESYGTNGQPAISVLGSRGGTDLITNGSGLLGNNTNFSAFTFDKVDTPVGTTGSFNTPANTQSFLDEFMPVDPARKYLMRFQAKQKGTAGAYAYAYLSPYDAFGNIISPQFYVFQNNTTTTLAVDLKPGDTTITLTSAANWNNAAGTATWNRSLIAWGFTDAGGKVWGERTYSRDWRGDLWADSGISGNVITLKTPWVGFTNANESGRTTIPAGTVVSNGSSGGNYMYGGMINTVVPTDWTTYQAEFGGIMPSGPSQTAMSAATTSFPPGTSTVKMGFLQNRQSSGAFATGSVHSFAALSFSDATQAQYLTESWRSPNTTTINGGVITTGTVAAIVMKANSAFVTTLNIGSGGGIQSTGYTAGGTSGFRLDTSGLVIKGTGNQIDVNAIVTSTLTSTTIGLGANGVISVGVGGTISIDGSTGQLKSNNYAANSTGYRLSNAGLEVNDGSIDAKVLKTGTAIIGDLTIGRSADALGTIKSYDYAAGSAGWKIGKGLFEINQGTVRAAALQIQDSDNIMPAQFADFEFVPSYYTVGTSSAMYSASAPTSVNILTASPKFNKQYLSASWAGAVAYDPYIYFAPTVTTYNIPVEAGETYIISAYARATGSVATNLILAGRLSNGTAFSAISTTLPASNSTWTRYSATVTIPAGVTAINTYVQSTTRTAGAGFEIDGIQVERKVAGLNTPSLWTPPGSTSIDAGIIRTGQLQSTSTVTVNGTSQPAWSINMSGNAQFGSALVRGNLIVGAANTNIAPGGGTFESNITGYTVYAGSGSTSATLARTTTSPLSGTASALANSTSSTDAQFGLSFALSTPIPAGVGFTLRALFQPDNDSGLFVALNDGTTSFLYDLASKTVKANTTYQLLKTYVPASPVSRIYIYSFGTTAKNLRFDNIEVLVDPDLGNSYAQSGNFVSGISGWKIDSSGVFEVNNGVFRGTIDSAAITGASYQTSTGTGAVVIDEYLVGGTYSAGVQTTFSQGRITLNDADPRHTIYAHPYISPENGSINSTARLTIAGPQPRSNAVTTKIFLDGDDNGTTPATIGLFSSQVTIDNRNGNSEIPVVAKGSLSIPIVANGGTSNITVTFPGNMAFLSTPNVFVNAESTRLNAVAVSRTSNGFTFQVSNWSGANSSACTGTWFAVL
jgi:hypothetical protein